ncbi:MAG: autotransporter domain-containing protein [Pseudomonas sp.]|uniref:autotransporter domain-containing protein n=1 Tax=Pseudomonas sp. TaxID=306 RepID=UPI00339B3F40
MKRVLTPLAAACLLALAPAVQASPYSGFVVFGDSLSDAGQFPDTAGPDGATRRFTNRVGPTFQGGSGEIYAPNATMLISEQLGLGPSIGSTSPVNEALGQADGRNYAVGGNITAQVYDSITGSGEGSVVETTDGTNLRVREAYLVELANRGLAVDPNTLFYVSAGGNDFLDGLILSQPQAVASAGRVADSVRALQAAGARYIVVPLLGDVSQTPFALNAGVSDFIAPLAAGFNQELAHQLAGIDAEIIPLNVPLLVKEAVANPGQFGLATDQNLTLTCFDGCANVNPVYGINGTTPDPTRLLFNDGVHPTITGQRIVADYTVSLLSAPYELTLLPEMAHGTLRAHQDQLRSQWQADWQAWQPAGQLRTFVSGSGQQQDFDRQAASVDADSDGYALNLGASYRLDDAWRVGLALGLDEQELDAEASDYQLRSYLLTAFAQYQHNRWWADLSATGGKLDYDDLQRGFDLGVGQRTEKGDTEGDLWAFGGRLGYDIAEEGSVWHLSPFVSGDYARVEVDGYSESGARSTALAFGDQERTSKRLGVGLQGRYALSADTQLFGEVAHEREYEDDASELDLSLNSLPSLGFSLQGYTPEDKMNRVSLGFNQQLGSGLALRGGYSLRQGEDDTQQGVNLSLVLDL